MTLPAAQEPVSVESLVTATVDDFLERQRRGEQPDIEEYVRRHPQLATLLRSLLPMLRLMQAEDSEPSGGNLATVPLLERLGDYRILRLIGRGGMGMVYEAEQLSLKRRVALKVLPFAAALDPLQLQRFKNEAQAAAQLQHPRIVPVFAVGEEQGIHYFAMQYVEGQSVAGLLRQRRERAVATNKPEASATGTSPTIADASSSSTVTPLSPLETAPSIRSGDYLRAAVQLAIQAAGALEHAHRQGVIHRDIKPANLLLDKHGDLWLTDFGLARFVRNTGLTQSGDVVGTLQYMSPEQASAKHDLLDQRTDVYALGATLYELLTLEPPFAGSDRQQLLQQIAEQDPRWPRGLNPSIAPDLETIVLKALEKNPADRYGTAQELADELQRFLDDQPIRARRPTWSQRFVKWSRRHRTSVAAAAVVLFLAAGFFLISTFWVWQERNLRLLAALDAERREQEQTKASLEQSLEMLEQVFLESAERRMLREDERKQADQDLLERGLRFYRQFVDNNATDPVVRFHTAKAHFRVAYIQQHLGRLDEAGAAYDHAVKQLERLGSDFPQRPQYRRDLAEAFHMRSAIRSHKGDGAGAVDDLRKEEKLLTELLERYPWAADCQTALAACRRNRAVFLYNAGQLEGAENLLREYLSPLAKETSAHPDDLALRHELAAGYAMRGHVLAAVGQTGRAEEAYRDAIRIAQDLAERAPTANPPQRRRSNEYRLMTASLHHQSAALLRQQGRLDEARRSHEIALGTFRRLVADFPSMPDLQKDLAEADDQYGLLLTALAEHREAEKAFREATGTLERLTQSFPTRLEYRMGLASAWNDFGNLFAKSDRPADAEQAYARAADGYAELFGHFPRTPTYASHLGGAFNNLARIYRLQGDDEKAMAGFATAVYYQRSALGLNPAHAGYRAALCSHYQNLIQLLLAREDHASAARRAQELARDLPDFWLAVIRAANALEGCWDLVANEPTLSPEERTRLQQAYASQARAWLDQTAELAVNSPDARDELAWHLAQNTSAEFRDAKRAVALARAAVKMQPRRAKYWLTLGSAYCRLRDWPQAIEALHTAWRLDREESGELYFFLAIAHWHDDARDQAQFWYRRGLSWMRRHHRDADAVRGFQAEAAVLLAQPTDGSPRSTDTPNL